MIYIATTKFGNCSICPATNVRCVKRKKDLICISCARGADAKKQSDKAQQRERERAEAVKGLAPKKKRELKGRIKNDVRNLGGSEDNRSTLLQRADNVFREWVFARDRDLLNNIICPCCGQKFNLDAVDDNGERIVQPLHYVSRSVYSLRFDPDNVFSGCKYDNLKMHLELTGQAQQNYRKFLVNKLGETAVKEMEEQKRKLHKMDNSQLKVIIEHYQP